MRILAPFAVAIALAAAVLPVAHADDSPAAKRRAKKLLTEGDTAFQKGDFQAALGKYQKAYETFASPKIFFAMAQAEENLGRNLEAIGHYEQLLDEAPELAPEVQENAKTRIAALLDKIAVITFEVDPNGATIIVDDIEIGTAPLDKPLRLLPGPHKFTVLMEGYAPLEQEVELVAGDRPTERIVLRHKSSRREAVRKVDPVTTVITGPEEGPSSGRGGFYTGLAFTGAFTVGAATAGVLAMMKHDTFGDTSRPQAEREDARTSGKTMALVADCLVGGAVVAGAFTTWWYLTKVKSAAPHEEPGSPASPEADEPLTRIFTPYVSPDGAGVVLSGSF